MPVGKTKDAGWEIGVSITVDGPAATVWQHLIAPEGVAVWLGKGVEIRGQKGERYETTTGVSGDIRSYRPGDRIRLTWQPEDWDHESTVQIALQDKGEKTGVRFHQERLADAEERAVQRAHWQRVAGEFRTLLDARAQK